ncbi:hypothetical protein G6R40_05145 [Chryseobacterium sp. POL2]|uniref:DUF6438 domain-containing protein n=1 Tax=Chryseobacterium sp. POL2 TaxID=2713414 RepID=UPI0013E11771|nr:DUF6438 domain-containing protein [Chryseobacterium sp. POL2]QIG89094.1 hypothetical protein G6R40_05145 [Chryseobacterium sp. POL2]
MKYLLSLFSILLLTACQSHKSVSKYQKLEYETTPCFGFCPIFKITINADKSATFEAEHFNFGENHTKTNFSAEREGTFKTTIKAKDYNKLVALIDELDPKQLNDFYGDKNIMDMPTSFLRINYTDGTSKIIEDYGKRGTPKLKEVYKFFADLRLNQTWKKVK